MSSHLAPRIAACGQHRCGACTAGRPAQPPGCRCQASARRRFTPASLPTRSTSTGKSWTCKASTLRSLFGHRLYIVGLRSAVPLSETQCRLFHRPESSPRQIAPRHTRRSYHPCAEVLWCHHDLCPYHSCTTRERHSPNLGSDPIWGEIPSFVIAKSPFRNTVAAPQLPTRYRYTVTERHLFASRHPSRVPTPLPGDCIPSPQRVAG